MTIFILAEGQTEGVFQKSLRDFIGKKLGDDPPRIRVIQAGGGVPTQDKLRRTVLARNPDDKTAVIVLTDIHGTIFANANDAKSKIAGWLKGVPNTHVHVALHDFEAWLLPYWDELRKMADHKMAKPAGAPERVNSNNPPAYRIAALFNAGGKQKYSKPVVAKKIFDKHGIDRAIAACPELKALVNTILNLCKATPV